MLSRVSQRYAMQLQPPPAFQGHKENFCNSKLLTLVKGMVSGPGDEFWLTLWFVVKIGYDVGVVCRLPTPGHLWQLLVSVACNPHSLGTCGST